MHLLFAHFPSLLSFSARSFCPPIYPLQEQQWQLNEGTPLICLHALKIMPSPLPPSFASETVIDCQPLVVCAGSFDKWLVINLKIESILYLLLPMIQFDNLSIFLDSSPGRIMSEDILFIS